ncbi:hypothetical protein AMS62_25825 [Bacillus sp. FJAT-18019]|nr:hypothetical protein AMS62_25825 [Bacillus sp. FJAT-18019]
MGAEKRRSMRVFVFFSVLLVIIITGCFASQDSNQIAKEKELLLDTGSEMKLSNLSEQKIMDLAKLGKVWGVVKYYQTWKNDEY